MTNAMLIDLTKCIGCRGCQAACKQWHDLPAEETYNLGSYQNPQDLSAKTWSLVQFNEIELNGDFIWLFTKRQCMHCLHPACVSACTVGALQKTEGGPVVVDTGKCIGCRYCQYACPFGVPSFEWDQTLGMIGKCNMCIDRVSDGVDPACVKACATGACVFGEREDLLTEAKRRIASFPHAYTSKIYGEKEAGGTSVLYLSPIPFAKLGFPALGEKPISVLAEKVVGQTPAVAVGMAALATGLYYIITRRERGRTQEAVKVESKEEGRR